MNPGTEDLLFGKHTSMYGKGTELGTTTSKGCYINTGFATRLKTMVHDDPISCTVI